MLDKFTNLIEAKPVTSAKSRPFIDFIYRVVHHYGVPHCIIMNNGSNFVAQDVKD